MNTPIPTADPASAIIQGTQSRPAGTPETAVEVNGKWFMEDAKGVLTPVEVIRPTDLLEDETVRRVMGFARPLSAQVARFKQHTLDDILGLLAIFDQEYGVKKGGTKGNVTLTSYDGTLKIQLAIADQITFGPELQSAKALVDECVLEWSHGARPELAVIVQRAFNTDKAGLVNRAELFRLLRLEIEDVRWKRAMTAIKDSIRPVGTKEYVRFYERADPRSSWTPITIDVAVS
ncbi:MAG: DUF3164 family protein [Brevundimonas sp.]|uniref:DUF3164 family protein n=1 Tax=Brevundimonas sp. TaxID=1871086 RepID=UPI001A1CB5D7|nr:DUF3164 family protein [Brevundimonas sp.]MBJ7318270.1 DUF3164 family protein [Brevundimonas sp.]